VINNHYKFGHLVDEHNAKQHSPISLEVVWATKIWANMVFSFLLAITEMNWMLGFQYFYKVNLMGYLHFGKCLQESESKTLSCRKKQVMGLKGAPEMYL
jgi:hypothetical protein